MPDPSGERKARFFHVARRFKESSDPAESERLREELADMIFGHASIELAVDACAPD